MALLHAKRTIADRNIILAVDLLAAEMKVSDSKSKELRICNAKADTLLIRNQFLVEENAYMKNDLDIATAKIARLRPWATIGRIGIYGGIAVGVFVLINETTSLIP